MDLREIMWLRQGEKEAKSLDRQAFSHLPDASRRVSGSPGVTLRSPLAISLSSASAFVLSERAAVAPSVRYPYLINLMDLREI